MKLQKTILAVAAVFLTSTAMASSLSIFPISVHMNEMTKSRQVNVRNEDKGAVTVEIAGKDWGNSGKDLMIYPPIATIEPGATQVYRVVYRGETPKGVERTYRLSLTEIRDPSTAQGLQQALSFSLPVFIGTPMESVYEITAGDLSKSKDNPKANRLILKNTGARHAKFVKVIYDGNAHDTLIYILANSTTEIDVPLAAKSVKLIDEAGHETALSL